ITAAAEAGDSFAIDRLEVLGVRLGEGAASLAAVLDPTLIVVGGGVAAAGELVLASLRRAFLGHLTGRGHRPAAEIVPAQLGNKAGMLGAADLARPVAVGAG